LKVSDRIPFLTIFLTFRASFGENVVNPKSPINCIYDKALHDRADGGNPFTTYMTSYTHTPRVPLKTDNDTGDQGDRTSARAVHRSCVWSTRTHSTYIYTCTAHTPQTNTRYRFRPRSLFSHTYIVHYNTGIPIWLYILYGILTIYLYT